ncbi:MAG: hypothetical protein JWM89_3662 [Acidimicrobiales bacterium]|nr:hypothetical protein [Acidimicrobiales bacterium]
MSASDLGTHDVFATGDAEILDRGYRSYDGERRGVRGAVWAVVRHSVQRALGMRRTLWAKLLPIFAAGIAYVPAVVFVGIVALFKSDEATQFVLPTYAEYYGFIIAALVVFAAIVAPEVLCTDRRSGMLGVYLASPLDRDTYLLAKAAAIAFVLSIGCLGPPLLMLVANVLQSQGPKGASDIALTAVRILGSGLLITLLFTGITMGVASLTDRKAIAAAGVLLVILVTIMVAGTLSTTGGTNSVLAIAPTLLTIELAARVHGEYSTIMPGAPSAIIWLAWAVWTVGGFTLARIQLHRLPVTR